MSSRTLRRLDPLRAFDIVRQAQPLVRVGCDGFSPSRVEAGADRAVDVTASFVNNTDEFHDIRWGATVDGAVVGGFNRVSVPPPTVRLIFMDTQTITIPAEILPSGGGSVEIGVQQRFGRQQSDVCGDLTVEPAPEEPEPEPVAGAFDVRSVDAPRSVEPGESFDVTAEVACEGTAPLFCDGTLRFLVDSRTVVRRDISFDEPGSRSITTPNVGPFNEAGRRTITVEIGGARASTTVQVEEPTPEFDSGRVTVPPDECNVRPRNVSPPVEVELTATVRNRNDVPAAATVEWTWQGQRLAVAGVNVSRNSSEIASTRATIDREGRGKVRAEVTNASESVEGLLPHPLPSTPASAFSRVLP